jgi:hypothetical protein
MIATRLGKQRTWVYYAVGMVAVTDPRVDQLLEELLERVDQVLDTQDRVRGLLDAVVAIAADLLVNLRAPDPPPNRI